MNYSACKLDIDNILTSCGCNRTPNSVHWSQSGELLYAANNGVALVQINSKGRTRLISSKSLHSDRVNCVRWLTDRQLVDRRCSNIFLSGGVDRSLYLCQYTHTENKVLVLHSYSDSEASIVCCDGLICDPNSYILVSSAGDSYVRVYRPDKDDAKAVQSIKFGSGFILAIHMTFLPGTTIPMMACAGDDMKIHIFTWQKEQFEKVISLQGHEDWIRGLEFTVDDGGDLLLASCSQDCFVRVWRVKEVKENAGNLTELFTENEIKLKQNLFFIDIGDDVRKYSVVVETVLYGHEGWVYGVHWHPHIDTQGVRHQPMRMLTASMDKTMIIWEPDVETGVWEEKLRVGEVGGNTLGLYGCQFSPDGNSILAHGYHGAFTVWHRSTQSGSEEWSRGVAVGGHFGDVTDVAWDPHGEFLITTSSDQTTRLFAPWKETEDWYEMGRPQVHGYDLHCLAMIGRSSFASGADEKVVRVFQCPLNFLHNLENLSDVDFSEEMKRRSQLGESIAQGASVPALGLSNKAVFKGKTSDVYEDKELQPAANDQYSESSFRPLKLDAPPSEDNLLQNTLWPETSKLYGHGFEIFSLAANPQGTVLASACKASKAEYAGIILWDTSSWQQLQTLNCHSLTVVQIEFSHSGDRLLSVSRDRTWALHQFDYTTGSVKKIAYTDKKTAVHNRIIWSCCWTFDDIYFLTVSRDKKVVFWSKPETLVAGSCTSGYEACSQAVFSQPTTAVCVAPVQDVNKRYLVGVGLESGEIVLCSWNLSVGLEQLYTLDTSSAHHMTVRRLRFRPKVGSAGKNNNRNLLQLASCGQDHQLKVYNIAMAS